MMQLEAVIFDVDGTLADTEEVHRRAFNRAFKEFDLDWNWTPKIYEELLSISGGYERITYYAGDLAEQFRHAGEFSRFAQDVHKVKSRFYIEMLEAGEIPLRTGVRRLLEEIRDSQLMLAIATSSTYANLKTLLDRNLPANWMSWFSAISTCDTITKKKPSPAVYESVLGILEIGPTRAIAIEDTVNGCLSATAAGLSSVITTHFFTRNHHFPSAAIVLDSLGDQDAPFKIIRGDAGTKEFVDLELLEQLVARRARQNAAATVQARVATA
jgi:beta-phosphoglucomutase-like phosphatase (HAD superfamily)